MNKIKRTNYPELDRILWDTKQVLVEPEDALNAYERRWGFVDKDDLTDREVQLIETLSKEAGGFLPACA